jgi:hypothetical protein
VELIDAFFFPQTESSPFVADSGNDHLAYIALARSVQL